MATNSQLAATLLRNAAAFFRDLGSQNEELTEQMGENAKVYDMVADMVEEDPEGQLADSPGGEQQ